METPPQNGLVADEVRLVIEGAVAIEYTAVETGAVVLQPGPLYASVTLYAPVIAPPEVVNVGETFVALVVAAISGPLHAYTGEPVPPAEVAVSVIAPPEQNGLVADPVNNETEGCATTVTRTVYVDCEHPGAFTASE
jgi:hypothetical protein